MTGDRDDLVQELVAVARRPGGDHVHAGRSDLAVDDRPRLDGAAVLDLVTRARSLRLRGERLGQRPGHERDAGRQQEP